jgi:hypothetical protein
VQEIVKFPGRIFYEHLGLAQTWLAATFGASMSGGEACRGMYWKRRAMSTSGICLARSIGRRCGWCERLHSRFEASPNPRVSDLLLHTVVADDFVTTRIEWASVWVFEKVLERLLLGEGGPPLLCANGERT